MAPVKDKVEISVNHFNLFLVTEPRLCWTAGVARKLEDHVPYSGYDGA